MGTTTSNPDLLDDGDDQKFRHLVYDTMAFGARLASVRDGLGSLIGLPGPQYSILITIRMLTAQDEKPSVGAVAAYMHVSGTFVTAESKRLEQKGLLEKHNDPSDGRRVLLALTAEAHRRLNELTVYQVPVNDTLFAGINRREFETLCSVMQRLVVQSDEALQELDYILRRRTAN
ncbi:MarR family winged helix-turn-helix transcriptional regulator [Ruicaihuangia caeni]|uniref:MarR family winged helix-turn-helix transcriptional regulator n=1 Tax=Ruicaihuangia caeni TaxID=3042517 RepID=A0AAW6TBL1_9MICO|nr:MarR family winged helix-turn-helix transcriptional regulator [Klugiella sp. YN-L-19]MDI2099368.1 MarR family winged helix-turn-helix transcriptional regulator [Klugiella sp. YN-L-19]